MNLERKKAGKVSDINCKIKEQQNLKDEFYNRNQTCIEKNVTIEHDEKKENKEILIEAAHLSVNFPVKKTMFFEKQKYLQAVTDVSLRIYKGETFGLVGESGCGKSTFANTTLGITKPTSGKLFFAGENIQSVSKERRKELKKQMQKIFH